MTDSDKILHLSGYRIFGMQRHLDSQNSDTHSKNIQVTFSSFQLYVLISVENFGLWSGKSLPEEIPPTVT